MMRAVMKGYTDMYLTGTRELLQTAGAGRRWAALPAGAGPVAA